MCSFHGLLLKLICFGVIIILHGVTMTNKDRFKDGIDRSTHILMNILIS